jgi:hypothetical protein
MNAVRRNLAAILLCVWCAAPGTHLVLAQKVTDPSLPPVPAAKSPVDAFRELLAMEPAAQRAALTNRSEASRLRLTAKVREYKTMNPDERELRLLATELRWYLLPLMQLPATNRAVQLTDLRADLRPLIESRLARWDALPAELREQFIHNEEAMALLLKIGAASERLQQKLVAEVSPALRDTLHRSLARLDAMSPAERANAFAVFENAFTMTPAEKQKALGVMSAAEKQQMEKTLVAFGNLPKEERKKCIRAYERFAGMTADERTLFYRNAQVWEKMSPKERQEWRDMVKNVELMPPLPEPKLRLPPLPPDPPPRLTTNRT